MRCVKCGNELKPGAVFCVVCGTKVEQIADPRNMVNNQSGFQGCLYDNQAQTMQNNETTLSGQGSYSDFRRWQQEHGPGTYADYLRWMGHKTSEEDMPVNPEPPVEKRQEKKRPAKLRLPAILAIAGAAVAVIVAVVLILGFAGQKNLGDIEVHLKHGDMIIGHTYSDEDIEEILDEGGYEKYYNPDDGVMALKKKYGLSEDNYNLCELRFKNQKNGEWLFYRADVGRKGYGVEDIRVGQDFEDVLAKYPDLVGSFKLDDKDASSQWHLRMDAEGKVVEAYQSIQEQYEDPDDFDGIILKVVVDADGEVVCVLVANY